MAVPSVDRHEGEPMRRNAEGLGRGVVEGRGGSSNRVPLRRYLRAEEAFTQLTVLDTLEDLVNEGSAVLEGKGRRLRWSLIGLVVAAGLFAAGILVRTL